MIQWNLKNEEPVFETVSREGVPFLSFRALDRTGMTINGFSTRLGGASRGKFSTMNFSLSRGDEPEAVRENFSRMANALGVDVDKMVLSHQTHTTNIHRVTEADLGKGVVRESDFRDIDGLITDLEGVTLVTVYADCVPLYFLDKTHRAIGLSHSGWRGTVHAMAQVTLREMEAAFGTGPEDLEVCIGPSICRDCFEVGEEVVREFREVFPEKYHDSLMVPNGKPGKYQLDLWRANQILFLEAGLKPEQIHTTNLCTMCNSDYLFSHRKMGNERGNLGAFLALKTRM